MDNFEHTGPFISYVVEQGLHPIIIIIIIIIIL